jgi:hypothetical protein
MARTIVSRTFRGVYDAIFRPSQFVSISYQSLEGPIWNKIRQLTVLAAVFVFNLLLYALPLTIAGFGAVPSTGDIPLAVMADAPTEEVRFLLRFFQNSLYLTGAAAATFLAFHAGVLLTRSSQGLLASLYTVTYSTSGYLAAIFSFVVSIQTSAQLSRTADLLIWLQVSFVYSIIDLLNTDLVLEGVNRGSSVAPQELSTFGQFLVASLLLACFYYLYSMYLGSRLNHNASRTTAALTVLSVMSTPIFFVIASVVAAVGFRV